MLLALPQAAFFLFLEAAVGGAIALLLVHLRGEVAKGFTLFTGWCLWVSAVLAVALHWSFPPLLQAPGSGLWFAAEQTLSVAFVVVLLVLLVALHRGWTQAEQLAGPLVPLVGLAALWSAAMVEPGTQLFGYGAAVAALAGAVALGSVLTGLSLGHWYLVAPNMSLQPLIRVNFLCLGALVAQVLLMATLLLAPGSSADGVARLFGEQAIFLAVRVLFGLAVPLAGVVMVWRTARIRSLDSATGILYVVATLVLVGEIAARSLFFLTGVAT
jgi:DMSO reductase anchor subunit